MSSSTPEALATARRRDMGPQVCNGKPGPVLQELAVSHVGRRGGPGRCCSVSSNLQCHCIAQACTGCTIKTAAAVWPRTLARCTCELCEVRGDEKGRLGETVAAAGLVSGPMCSNRTRSPRNCGATLQAAASGARSPAFGNLGGGDCVLACHTAREDNGGGQNW